MGSRRTRTRLLALFVLLTFLGGIFTPLGPWPGAPPPAAAQSAAYQAASGQGTITGTVHLQGRDDHSAVRAEVVGTDLSAAAGAGGAFTITGVPVGTYQLTARVEPLPGEEAVHQAVTSVGTVEVQAGLNTAVPALTLLLGDYNQDGHINHTDLSAVSAHYGSTTAGAADLNNDGIVDLYDLVLLTKNLYQTPVWWTGHVSPSPPAHLPPDPATVAPPVDATVASGLFQTTAFLYTGPNPIQTGVEEGVIEIKRAAVLRGQVSTRDGVPLPGVTITIPAHPEFGQTLTRADGMFDMAVNGGGLITLRYEKEGYLTVQRQVQVPWQDFAWLPDVVMISLDNQVTTVSLNGDAPTQVARGSVVDDEDGARQATILFPAGTLAEMVMPDGSTLPLETLSVRATEYTVGDNGPAAMPGELPANVGYTYAVELSVDEALANGARDVTFNQPVYFHLENFLDFPVGGIVPMGWYDRDRAAWVPSENGLVIGILGTANGLAQVDVDGSGLPAGAAALEALGFTDAEREQLAGLYQPAQSLWRVPITHFTPWDCNWPFGPPEGAEEPPASDLEPPSSPCLGESGSVIKIHQQLLGQELGIDGSPFSLHYMSDRVPGYKAANTLEIWLSRTEINPLVKEIELVIELAGRRFENTFAALPNQRYTFVWDGRDAYGRQLFGQQRATVRIGYTYDGVYQRPASGAQSFGLSSGTAITGSRTRQEVTLWQQWTDTVGLWDVGLGGWSLDVHHAYNPHQRILYLGDGGRQSAQDINFVNVITTVAGTGAKGFSDDGGPATAAQLSSPRGVVLGPDGSLYIADTHRIRRVGPDGIITTVAGTGTRGFSGDGGPATQAQLNNPHGIALASDGSLYISDSDNHRIRRVGPDGIITTVAGGGGSLGDGGPATAARLNRPYGVALGPDGSLYISDTNNHRIRRVGPDGIITTVSGTGTGGFSGDGGPATEARLDWPYGVALGPDGSLYISDTFNHRIRRVGPDGIITTVSGTGTGGFSGDGGPATAAQLSSPRGVALSPGGSLYIADGYNHRIRRVGPDGIITTVAGKGRYGFLGDGGPATAARLIWPHDVALGPDGSLYIADTNNHRIRRVGPLLPGTGIDNYVIPAQDGRKLYIFDQTGRHLRTLDALTVTTIYEFTYNDAGHLTAVTDGDGNTSTIERDAGGAPAAITAPGGQTTTFTLDENGYLAEISNPAGETHSFTYADDGLMTTHTDPVGGEYSYTYNDQGRLIRAEDPAGGFKALTRTDFAGGYEITMATASGGVSTYRNERLPSGDVRMRNTTPCGSWTEVRIDTSGGSRYQYSEGTEIALIRGPDPRWGMQAPYITAITTTVPGGTTMTYTGQRTMELQQPDDPLSLKRLTDIMTINGQVHQRVYTAADGKIVYTSPEGRQVITHLDAQGRTTGLQAGGRTPVELTYDARGLLTRLAQGERYLALTYDAAGHLTGLTNPASQETLFAHDTTGRVTRVTLPGGGVIQLARDANGNVTAVTPPGRPAHAFAYTPVNLMRLYLPPDAAAGNVYGYDQDRRLTQITRPDGGTIGYTYADGSRLIGITLPHVSIGLTYNQNGTLNQITAPGGTITYSHDGRLVTGAESSGTVTGSITFSYDAGLRLAGLRINGQEIELEYGYDKDGLTTRAGALTITRSPQSGQVSGTALGGLTTATTHNNYGKPQSHTVSFNDAVQYGAQYSYDSIGRITGKTETMGGQTNNYTYTYDATGRLAEVRHNGSVIAAYGYDANGNRLSYTDAAGNTLTGIYDQQDRLLQYGAVTYTYTANGHLQEKNGPAGKSSYNYDLLDNLLSVTLPDGREITYVIDGRDRRIGKKVDGNLVQGFLYLNQLNPVAELDGNNNITSYFVYGTRRYVPDYMVRNGQTYRFVTDHLGSVRMVINTTDGTVVQGLDYDVFGRVLQDTNPGFQPFGFAGGLYDPDTGLVRFGARDYDPETGRWTAKDPLLFGGRDTNLYAYVSNDPVNWIDPGGLDKCTWDEDLDEVPPTEPIEMDLPEIIDALAAIPVWPLPIDLALKTTQDTPLRKGQPHVTDGLTSETEFFVDTLLYWLRIRKEPPQRPAHWNVPVR